MTTRSSARFCHLEMIITTIFNFILLWRWIWDSSQALIFVSSHLYLHFDQIKQPSYSSGKWHRECVTYRKYYSSFQCYSNLFCISYTPDSLLDGWRLDGAFNSSVCNCEPCSEMMKYVTSFIATSKQHLIIISKRLHQFFWYFFLLHQWSEFLMMITTHASASRIFTIHCSI